MSRRFIRSGDLERNFYSASWQNSTNNPPQPLKWWRKPLPNLRSFRILLTVFAKSESCLSCHCYPTTHHPKQPEQFCFLRQWRKSPSCHLSFSLLSLFSGVSLFSLSLLFGKIYMLNLNINLTAVYLSVSSAEISVYSYCAEMVRLVHYKALTTVETDVTSCIFTRRYTKWRSDVCLYQKVGHRSETNAGFCSSAFSLTFK